MPKGKTIRQNAAKGRLQKCECQHDVHFTSKNVHTYGAELPDVRAVKTPISTVQACKKCRETCLSIYKQG